MSLTGAPGRIALAGVPNVGKSTIFNALTGLRQKVGNYPGITVDKKVGVLRDSKGHRVEIIDLPGTYNLYPRSEDEQVVFRVLCGLEPRNEIDAVIAIVDMSQMERGLFFATQLIDLGLPVALVLNMEDQAIKDGIRINKTLLERLLGVPVFTCAADKGEGIEDLKTAIVNNRFSRGRTILPASAFCDSELLQGLKSATGVEIDYSALQMLKFRHERTRLAHDLRDRLNALAAKHAFNDAEVQRRETTMRYEKVQALQQQCVQGFGEKQSIGNTQKIDAVLLHRYWGFAIFLALLFLIFQAIFAWAELPMTAIDQLFAELSYLVANNLPEGALNSLLAEGILPGLAGIFIFIPQIALLFAFLSLLEGSGYMARAVFITDRAMRPFGLNGRSVVPLISGFACAIPAIMATRTIANRRDRLITIFVTPFMSCSARLPVYIVLIGLIIPAEGGAFFDQRGLALFGMYLLGILAALLSALMLKWFMKREAGGHLVLELPRYRWPKMSTVGYTMLEKVKAFVWEAGKVILAISIILWVLASYGPGDAMERAAAQIPKPDNKETAQNAEAIESYEIALNTARLEASYAGHLGKWIEPVIAPLGYDWKVGIALITSFAAREVFVSTMATLYSIGATEEDVVTIQERLREVQNSKEGGPFFTSAVVWSLLIFYAFAMQCMSTVAVVYRETKSWKWPVVQTVFMTLVAYLASLAVYQGLS